MLNEPILTLLRCYLNENELDVFYAFSNDSLFNLQSVDIMDQNFNNYFQE